MTADDVALAARVVVAIVLVASGRRQVAALLRHGRAPVARSSAATRGSRCWSRLALPVYELVLAALLLFVDASWPSWLAFATFAAFTGVLVRRIVHNDRRPCNCFGAGRRSATCRWARCCATRGSSRSRLIATGATTMARAHRDARHGAARVRVPRGVGGAGGAHVNVVVLVGTDDDAAALGETARDARVRRHPRRRLRRRRHHPRRPRRPPGVRRRALRPLPDALHGCVDLSERHTTSTSTQRWWRGEVERVELDGGVEAVGEAAEAAHQHEPGDEDEQRVGDRGGGVPPERRGHVELPVAVQRLREVEARVPVECAAARERPEPEVHDRPVEEPPHPRVRGEHDHLDARVEPAGDDPDESRARAHPRQRQHLEREPRARCRR